MRVAIIGASGKTGRRLVREALGRGHRVHAVCRDASAGKLAGLADREECRVFSGPLVSDEGLLTRALAGCDAVVAVLISVRRPSAVMQKFLCT